MSQAADRASAVAIVVAFFCAASPGHGDSLDVTFERTAACGDFRTGEGFQVALQRLTLASGIDSTWSPDSSHLCVGSIDGELPGWVSDGSGGALVGWVDGRLGDADIYVQRLSSNGSVAVEWPAAGVALCTAPGSQYQLSMASDGASGAFAVWTDFRAFGVGQIFAQRVQASGAIASGWPEGGLAVGAAGTDQGSACVVGDGIGGAFVVWQERREGVLDVFAQHVVAGGVLDPAWPTAGRRICESPAIRSEPIAAADGSGGIVVAWHESSQGQGDRLRLTRLAANGEPVSGWPASGIAPGAALGIQHTTRMVADTSGGAFVAWLEGSGPLSALRVQRVYGSGAIAAGWSAEGVLVCSSESSPLTPALRPDGLGGVLIAWADRRSETDHDIFIQRITADGAVASGWPEAGRAACVAPGDQIAPRISADAQGITVVWSDLTASASGDYLNALLARRGPVPELSGITTAPGRASLTWHFPNGSPRSARLYRRAPDADWALYGTLEPNKDGRLIYEDRAAVPGSTMHYRLGFVTSEAEFYLAEIAVLIPKPKPLALAGVRPEPSGRGVIVGFTLPTADAARIDLIDIAGRRITQQSVGGLGAGDHEVRLTAAGGVPSGIYFVRLTQGAAIRTKKVRLMR